MCVSLHRTHSNEITVISPADQKLHCQLPAKAALSGHQGRQLLRTTPGPPHFGVLETASPSVRTNAVSLEQPCPDYEPPLHWIEESVALSSSLGGPRYVDSGRALNTREYSTRWRNGISSIYNNDNNNNIGAGARELMEFLRGFAGKRRGTASISPPQYVCLFFTPRDKHTPFIPVGTIPSAAVLEAGENGRRCMC